MGTGTQYKEELQERAETLLESGDPHKEERGAELAHIAEQMRGGGENISTPVVTGWTNNAGILGSDIEPQETDWFWPKRIPTGKVTMVYGARGSMKSTLFADIAARVSTGRPFPDGSESIPGGVVIASVEEDNEETIVPRLIQFGADMTKVNILTSVVRETTAMGDTVETQFALPTDLPVLEKAIKRVHAVMVILDPIHGVVENGTSIYRDQTVRNQVLVPLQHMARRLGVSVVIIGHFIKGTGKDLLDRCGGSGGIVNYARVVHAVLPDPTMKGRAMFINIKNNLAPLQGQIVFQRLKEDALIEYVHGQLPAIAQIAQAQKMSRARSDILALLASEPDRPFVSAEIAQTLDLENPNVRYHLLKMTEEGLIYSPYRGRYQMIPVQKSETLQDSQDLQDLQDLQDSQDGFQVQKTMSHEEYVQAVNAQTVPLNIHDLPEDQQTIVLNVLNGKGAAA